jgi:hypothetical protein
LAFSYWFNKPWFHTEGKLAAVVIIPSSWGSQLGGHLHQHRTTITPPASSLLWASSLSSDEDDEDEVLAPQTPLASAKDVVSGSVLGNVDVHLTKKAHVEPCGGLFADSAALGGKEDWVQVGRGGRPGRMPSSLL